MCQIYGRQELFMPKQDAVLRRRGSSHRFSYPPLCFSNRASFDVFRNDMFLFRVRH